MKIVRVKGDQATVSLSGLKKEIDVRLLSGPRPGDYVLVHAGFAIEKIDAGEAEKTLKLIREIELAR